MLPRHAASALLVTSASLALVGCPKKGDPPQTDTKATPPTKSSTAATTAPEKPAIGGDDKAKAAGSGCKLPERVSGAHTITQGCAVAVKADVEIAPGATLTIEKGAKLSFARETHLYVHEAKLIANGSSDAPIVFTSTDADPHAGDWEGIVFEKPPAGSILDHVEVSYAGKSGTFGAGAVFVSNDASPGRVALTNSSLHDNENSCVHVDWNGAVFAKLEGNTFKKCGTGSIIAAPNVYASIGKNTYADPLRVLEGELSTSATWIAANVPFVFDGSLEVKGSTAPAVLTLPDAAIAQFAEGNHLLVGSGSVGGGIVAKDVVFTSANTDRAAGDWEGLVVDSHATASKLEGCTIEDAGRDGTFGTGAIVFKNTTPKKLGARFAVTGLTIKASKKGISSDDHDCGDIKGTMDKGAFCQKGD